MNGKFYLQSGNIIDVVSGSIMVKGALLVDNGRIQAIGPNLKRPDDAQLVDLSGKYVMPGMIDAHTHIAASALSVPNQARGSLLRQNVDQSTAVRTIRGVANAQSLLSSGFTSIRDVGLGGTYADLAIVRGIDEGWISGPHTIASGKIIGPIGIHANAGLNPEHPELSFIDHIITSTVDEMREAVRTNMQYGAGLIKLAIEAGRLSYTEEEIKTAVSEANRAGLRVAVHAFNDKVTQAAVRAGVTSVEHGFNLSEETLQMMKEYGVWLVDTTFTEGSLDMATPANVERWLNRLRLAYEIGVPIAYGSDVFWHVPGRSRGELSLDNTRSYPLAGIPNRDMLKFITLNGATVMGIEGQTGSLDVGKLADIIALEENPLEDIEALRTASFVMKRGVIYKLDGVYHFEPTGFSETPTAIGRHHAIKW
ncbi:MAG: amidohydrolase family protein [Chloroflexota bacterium]